MTSAGTNPSKPSAAILFSAIAIILVSLLFHVVVGYGESSTWPRNVVQNWNDYGLGTFHGKMVANPGGFDVVNNPDVYKGHSAVSYYPVFAVGKLLGWIGDGMLMFHLIFTCAMFFSIRNQLGSTGRAWIGAWAAVLCPGYFIYPTIVDPNAIALYMMLPLSVPVVHILSAEKLSPSRITLLAVLILAYTLLNWSTAFGHGILFCALLVMPRVPIKRLAIYVGLAGFSVAIVGGLAVLEKMGGGAGTSGGNSLQTLLGSYTWGHTGYGANLTTFKAITRLTVVTTMGMLPIIGFIIWQLIGLRARRPGVDLLAFLPLFAATLCVVTMRNYFGVHPWMAGTMFLPALIMSLAALRCRNPIKPTADNINRGSIGFVIGCMVYSLAVVGAHRTYHAEVSELTSLVLKNTKRADTILLVQELDPNMAAQAESIAVGCDRHVVVIPDLKSPLAAGENQFVLSANNLSDRLSTVAHSKKSDLLSIPLFRKLSNCYSTKVARRTPQDRHFDYTAGSSFGLFRLSPSAR